MSNRLTHQKFADYAIKWGAHISQYRAENRHLLTIATVEDHFKLNVRVRLYKNKVDAAIGVLGEMQLGELTVDNLNSIATSILRASDIMRYAKENGAKE